MCRSTVSLILTLEAQLKDSRAVDRRVMKDAKSNMAPEVDPDRGIGFGTE